MISKTGVPVPPGFAITAAAYREFIDDNGFQELINEELAKTDINDTAAVTKASKNIRHLMSQGTFSAKIISAIETSFSECLQKNYGLDVKVAVRSSATAEDLPGASFAGQHDTFLNINKEQLLESVVNCFSSMYTPRAIVYRETKGFDHNEVAVSDAVQLMIDSEVSGIMFSKDPTHKETDSVAIDAIYGLGEYIVSGKVSADHFVVDKESGKLLKKEIATQKIMLTTDDTNKEVDVPKDMQSLPKLTDAEVQKLAEFAKALEKHYGTPQDIEWAKDRNSGELFIVQSRPITSLTESADRSGLDLSQYNSVQDNGVTASSGIGYGNVYVIKNQDDLNNFPEGAILVAKTTSPDYVPAMKKASAIITEAGSYVCHAAIIAREFGIPAIVAAESSIETLSNGDEVTVDADTHTVYSGEVSELMEIASKEIVKSKTQITSVEVEERPAKKGFYGWVGDLITSFVSNFKDKGEKYKEMPVGKIELVNSLVSPLNLTDAKSDEFSPENVETYHDIVRFVHEKAIDGMFKLKNQSISSNARKTITVSGGALEILDVGEALNSKGKIISEPLRAIHSIYQTDAADHKLGHETYNIIAASDYINASIDMGCHKATLDAMVTEESSNNFVTFQYIESGYAGSEKRKDLVKHLIGDEGFLFEEKTGPSSGSYYKGTLKATLKGASKDQSLEALKRAAAAAAAVKNMDNYREFQNAEKESLFKRCKEAFDDGRLDLRNVV